VYRFDRSYQGCSHRVCHCGDLLVLLNGSVRVTMGGWGACVKWMA